MIGLWSKLKTYAALCGAFFIALVLAFFKGRSDANRDHATQREKDRAAGLQARKETDDEIERLGVADVDQRLARWLRDGDR